MIPINNSDTAWLIVADYNQDNDIPYLDLIEDIYCPTINNWVWDSAERDYINVGDFYEEVGTEQMLTSSKVGVGVNVGGELEVSSLVGGNYYNNRLNWNPHAPN